MTMGAGVIVYLASLYSVTMLVVWCFIGRYRIKRLPRKEESFVLKKGQSISGVIDTKKTLYFYIDTDVRGEKSYE